MTRSAYGLRLKIDGSVGRQLRGTQPTGCRASTEEPGRPSRRATRFDHLRPQRPRHRRLLAAEPRPRRPACRRSGCSSPVPRRRPRRAPRCSSIVLAGGVGLAGILPCLFVMVAAMGLVVPNATALALHDYPHAAGSASALLGAIQFFLGAAAAPLVGVAGRATAVPMAVMIAVFSAAGLSAVLFAHSALGFARLPLGPIGSARERARKPRSPDGGRALPPRRGPVRGEPAAGGRSRGHVRALAARARPHHGRRVGGAEPSGRRPGADRRRRRPRPVRAAAAARAEHGDEPAGRREGRRPLRRRDRRDRGQRDARRRRRCSRARPRRLRPAAGRRHARRMPRRTRCCSSRTPARTSRGAAARRSTTTRLFDGCDAVVSGSVVQPADGRRARSSRARPSPCAGRTAASPRGCRRRRRIRTSRSWPGCSGSSRRRSASSLRTSAAASARSS